MHVQRIQIENDGEKPDASANSLPLYSHDAKPFTSSEAAAFQWPPAVFRIVFISWCSLVSQRCLIIKL